MMFTCQQLTDLVTTYLDGRLPLWDRLRFEVHVGMCPHCREYLAQMKTTVKALGHVPELQLPEPVERDLLERFRTWTPASEPLAKG